MDVLGDLKKILQITQPSQYRNAKLQYRFAEISGPTSICRILLKTVSSDLSKAFDSKKEDLPKLAGFTLAVKAGFYI